MPENRPAEYVVERRAVVPAPPPRVQELLVDFHRWTEWSPWENNDPRMARTYSGTDRGVGAVYEWIGDRKAGAGRMEITAVEPDRGVTIDLSFIKPFKARSTVRFTLAPVEGGTDVTWTMTGRKTYTTRFVGVFMSMDKIIGPDFERGLQKLAVALGA
jgi:uncharacterized protein YndB with AHSA1/START domain